MNLKQKILRIKEKVSIKEVLESYGIYKNKHSQNYHCPFHGEDKKPSGSIKKGFFHCFTCGKSWDIFAFVQEIEKCSLSTAVKLIDQKFECGCDSRLSKDERDVLFKASVEKKKKQELDSIFDLYKEQISATILNQIKNWEQILLRTRIKNIYQKEHWNLDIWFFKALKEIERLDWLYDKINNIDRNECEWDYIYNIGDANEILRKIYKKEITI